MTMNFGFANRHSTSGRSGGMPIGNIRAGQSFPTTRPDGSPLQLGDYVKPIGDLPFTVGSITFNTYNDFASWNTVEWVLNANPYQKTSETPVANKAEESLSGTSNYQNQVNKEVKEKLSGMKAKDVYVNGETVVDEDGIAQINVPTAVFDNKTIILEDGKRRTAIGGYQTIEPTDIMLIPQQEGTETSLGSGIYFNFEKVREIYLAAGDLVSVEVDIRTDTEHIIASCTDKTPQEYTIEGIGTCLGVELEGGTVEGKPIIYLDKNYGCVYCEGFQHHDTLYLNSATVKRDMPVFHPIDPRYVPLASSLQIIEQTVEGVVRRYLAAKIAAGENNAIRDTGFGLEVEVDGQTIKKNSAGLLVTSIGGSKETHSRLYPIAEMQDNLTYARIHENPNFYGIPFVCEHIAPLDEWGYVAMRITHEDGTYQDFVEDHCEITTKEYRQWALLTAIKLNAQFMGEDVHIVNFDEEGYCFIDCPALVATDKAQIVEMRVYREVTDYQPIDAGYIPLSSASGNAMKRKSDGLYVPDSSGQIDGESIVTNASGRMKTAIGGGMRTVTQTLTHHSDDTPGHYVPESESGYPLPFILFGNPVNVWHIGDEATVKLSINGVVYEQTKTVKSVSMIGETFRAIQLDDIIQSGSTTYIAESMFGTLFYSTAPFSATDVFILLHSEFVRTEEVRQHIDPLFIPIDLTSIVVNENGDLGVLISPDDENSLQARQNGLFAAGAAYDHKTILKDATGQMYTAVGGYAYDAIQSLPVLSEAMGVFFRDGHFQFDGCANQLNAGDRVSFFVATTVGGVEKIYKDSAQASAMEHPGRAGMMIIAAPIPGFDIDGEHTYFFRYADESGSTSYIYNSHLADGDTIKATNISIARTVRMIEPSDPSFIKISQQSGNTLQLKPDGLYAASGGGSVHEDEFTVTAQTAVMCEHTIGIKHPYIVCIDSEGCECIGSVDYIDDTKFTIEFNQPFTGKIFVH